MKKTEEKVFAHIANNDLVPRGSKIVVALSGGADSVFLLFLLNKYKKKFNIETAAVHVNHNLREDAGADEKFCAGICNKLGISFYPASVNVTEFAKSNKYSIEEAARLLRYEQLELIREGLGYDLIATAHNAGDNSETILLNLVKGTGLSGISGIPVKRDNIIRPILVVTKKEILEYLTENNLEFVTDLTNLDNDFERNYIRNKVIPLLKEINPNLDAALLNSSSIFRGYSDSVKGKVDEILGENNCFIKGVNLSYPLYLRNEPLLADIIRISAERAFGINLDFVNIKEMLRLFEGRTGRVLSLPSGYEAVKERGGVILYEPRGVIFDEISINPGERKKVNDFYLEIIEKSLKEVKFAGGSEEFIDADRIKGDFTIRKWNPGDRFYPIGSSGSKKISDFLNEIQIDYLEKHNYFLLTNQNKVVWVIGLRLDNRFKITEKTKRVYNLCKIKKASL